MTAQKKPETQTDEALAARIRGREGSLGALSDAQRAFTALFERHAHPLLAFLAGRVARRDLEDVHQLIWERIWRVLPDQFSGGNFRAWLFQIARNLLIDLSRKRVPDLMDPADQQEMAVAKPNHDPLVEAECWEVLGKCLSRLDDVSAELVRARLRGEDYADICERLELTQARAQKMLHLAKHKLQECVQRLLP